MTGIDLKLTALTELTTVADDDLFYVVHDPSGTPVWRRISRANLLKGMNINLKAATELTIASDAITITQGAHKLQPETGTADVLATISGMAAGDVAILFVSDKGTDTITVEHGTDNISCVAEADIVLSNGMIVCYSDGTTVYVSGGGGGGSGGDIVSQLIESEISVTGTITLDSGAFGKMHVCSGTAADYTVTLPAVSGNTGKIIGLRMSSSLTKAITIDGNSSEKIDGENTRIMWKNEVAILLCDGSGWEKISGKSIAMAAAIKSPTTESIANTTAQKITCSTIDNDNTGFIADSTNKKLVIKRPGIYHVIIAGQWSATAGTKGEQTMYYKNGSFVFNVSGASNAQSIGHNQSLLAGNYLELYQYQSSGGALNNYADDTLGTSIEVTEILQW